MEDLSHYNAEGSELRRAQMRMLEILDVFVDICNKHKINYWLACGTLLGARRHGGFIPWDDDLDVYVMQRDYNKLLSILQKELPEQFKLQARGTDKNYWHYHTKIRDTKSCFHYKSKKGDNLQYKGIFIDIFPIEPLPSVGFKKVIDNFLFSEIHFITAKSLYHKIKYKLMLSFLPIIRVLIMLTRFYYKHIGSKKEYNYAYGIFFYPTFNVENFFPVSEIIFEGKKYKAPGNVDGYLIENFDLNFLVIPKSDERKMHSTKIEFF